MADNDGRRVVLSAAVLAVWAAAATRLVSAQQAVAGPISFRDRLSDLRGAVPRLPQ
jgi:hypothetical protein